MFLDKCTSLNNSSDTPVNGEVHTCYLWGRFHQTFFTKRNVAGLQKICCSISPTIKTPNFKPTLAHFFAVCPICLPKKNASHPVLAKKQCEYVDEIDPLINVRLSISWVNFTNSCTQLSCKQDEKLSDNKCLPNGAQIVRREHRFVKFQRTNFNFAVK